MLLLICPAVGEGVPNEIEAAAPAVRVFNIADEAALGPGPPGRPESSMFPVLMGSEVVLINMGSGEGSTLAVSPGGGVSSCLPNIPAILWGKTPQNLGCCPTDKGRVSPYINHHQVTPKKSAFT